MKKHLLLSLAVIFSLSFSQLHAQQYVEMMHQKDIHFRDIQASFNNYWQNKPRERSKGWNQFKRWEYLMEPRLQGGLSHTNPTALWQDYRQKLLEQNQRSTSGVWTQIGPVNEPNTGANSEGIGRVNCIGFHPTDPNTFWIGAPAGGLWKTTDNGQSWSTNTDLLPNLGVTDIAIDANNPNVMYMATGDKDGQDTYSYGLLKSTDGGATWNTTGLSFNVSSGSRANRILIHPGNSNIILAATSGGIFRSTDAGANFTLESNTNNYFSMEFKPGDPNTVYAGTSSGAVYRSTNNGQTWTAVTSGLPSTGNVGRAEIGVSPANASYVYVLFAGNDDGFYGLYRSTDSGVNFSQRSNSPNLLGWNTNGGDSGGQGWYDLAIAVNPSNAEMVFVGGVNIWRSTNGGTSWSLVGHWTGSGGADYVHADQHKLVYSPDGRLFNGNDGGVFYSSNSGSTFNDLSDGLEITEYYRLGQSAQNADLVICGA